MRSPGLIGLDMALRKTQQITDAVIKEQKRALTKALLIIEHKAKDNARKVKSPRGQRSGAGGLLGHITHKVLGVEKGEVGVFGEVADYATFVEYGTGQRGISDAVSYPGLENFPDNYRPSGRPIVPITAQLLHWKDPQTGEDVFARKTLGSPPYPFLRPAVHDSKPQIAEELRKENLAIVKRFDVK